MRIIFLFMMLTFLFGCGTTTNPTAVENTCGTRDLQRSKSSLNDSLYDIGKSLFTHNCAACHSPNRMIVAWPFQKIRDYYGVEWTYAFIKDNESLIKQRDTRALYIFKKFNEAMMPKFPHLTDTQIKLLLDYVDSFEYNEHSKFYEHRHLSIKSMKDSIRIEENREKENWKDFKKALK